MSVNIIFVYFFVFKQKTAYEMRISDWSSRVLFRSLLSAVPSGRRLPADAFVVDTFPVLQGSHTLQIDDAAARSGCGNGRHGIGRNVSDHDGYGTGQGVLERIADQPVEVRDLALDVPDISDGQPREVDCTVADRTNEDFADQKFRKHTTVQLSKLYVARN